MEMYTGPEQGITETYMVPAIGPNPQAYLPQLEGIDYMSNEVAPEFIFDQGLYYPAANYYGYYCTGFESPGDWDDQNRFLGLDGQDLHYSGLQTESLPYVYYTPSYGYAQSPYNPYNPYIPGAVVGLDGPYIGTEQYAADPTNQLQVPSPAYIPMVVQQGTDAAPNSSREPSLFGMGPSVPSRHVHGSLKYVPLSSTDRASISQRSAVLNPHSDTSQTSRITAKPSEGPIINLPTSKLSLAQEVPLGRATQMGQVKSSSGSAQATHKVSHGRVHSAQNPLRNTMPTSDGFTRYGSNVREWAAVDKFRPRLQFNGILSKETGGTEVLSEQNKGPITASGAYATKSDAASGQRSITIDANTYNRTDFQVNYPVAKFYVIKSYSEDDVHKSIKYNVWSSTPNGNKRLYSAYEDAQKISVAHFRNCPIFLFFSVNASGQFCGVAEMINQVDFNKDMDFWHQDKWSGSFPVKWHMIKDVPNTNFRHIILENNENKPVTNSRDTQEIPYLQGINMLNIFKSTPLKTCILDDFKFYEDRERIMQEEKARLSGRNYDTSQFVPAIFPFNKTGSVVSQTPTADGKQLNEAADTDSTDRKQLDATDPSLKGIGNGLSYQFKKEVRKEGRVEQSSSSSGGSPITATSQPSKAELNPPSGTVNHLLKADEKLLDNAIDQSQKTDGAPQSVSVVQSSKTDGNQSKLKNIMTTDAQTVKADRSAIKPKDILITGAQTVKADRNSVKSKDLMTTGVQTAKTDKNAIKQKDPKNMTGHLSTAGGIDLKGKADQLPKADENDKSIGDQHHKAGGSSRCHTNATIDGQVAWKTDSVQISNGKKDAAYGPTLDATAANAKKDDASSGGTVVTDVTVGSMRRNAIKQKDPKNMTGQLSTAEGIDLKGKADQLPKADEKDKSIGDQHRKVGGSSRSHKNATIDGQVAWKTDSVQISNGKKDAAHGPTLDATAVNAKKDDTSNGGTVVTAVTVGSMRIKVKGPVEPSSSTITVGTIPIEPKALNIVNKKKVFGGSHQHE